VGVDRYRVCELYAQSPDGENFGSGSGYRLSDRLVLTARHVIAPALAGTGGHLLVRPVGVPRWLPAQVEWQDADADAALAVIEDQAWRAPAGESVLRWGELAGSDPVPCAAVGFPWASVRPDAMRDTAHVYGQLAPLGQLRQGRLDLDMASASPSAREGGSPWAGLSGAAVIADSHLVGVITVDPARYQDRLVAVPASGLLADESFRARLAAHGVQAEAAPVGVNWHLQLVGGQTVRLAPPYWPVSTWLPPEPSTLLDPQHGLVPFLGRQPVLDQITAWCQDLAGRPVLLLTGGGGSGKTRLGREACVQMMLVSQWDAGLADDLRRSGTPRDRLQRPTLLVVDDADLRTGLISALIDYRRWDKDGPPIRLLLLARAAGAWWERLVRQQGLGSAYTVLDLDRHPVPLTDRAEHFRRASIAFAAYGGPGAQPVAPPPSAELDDPAYAEPLLIQIAALLRTADISATAAPGAGERRALGEDLNVDQGPSVRQGLLRALCERERTRWYRLGQESHLSFKPDLPLADQVVALATLTAADNQACATSLLGALPNQAEVTRIGAEALVVWAHRLYSGPGYWNPLRPDLLAEQHLADTAQLSALVVAAARLAARERWEASVLTQLLAELTRSAPTQPAVRVALGELLADVLPRIVDVAVTGGHAELADLASLALQLAPQPHLAAPLALELADFLGEGGREDRAIELLETRIAAAESDPAFPAADLLEMQRLLAWHVGEKAGGSGDPKRALEIARRVVRDSTTVYGPAHRKTLEATITLARQVGATGNQREALAIAREVDAAATAAFGGGDWTTLSARFEVATWTRMVDGAGAGAERFAELIRQAERLEAPPQLLIADSTANLANCLSESGDHTRAIQASQDAIDLTQQLYGARHARVLQTRLTHASVVGSSGDPQAAADLSGQLADDCAEIIGESHLTTLWSRRAAAHWAAVGGDHAGAARRYEALLTDLAEVVDDDHRLAQQCRIELAELKYLWG
jgi:tetratricopeptide (TPR) repeat protein